MSDEPPNRKGQTESGGRLGGIFGRLTSSRPEGSSYPRAEFLPRLLARLTDLILASVLPLSAGDAGFVLAILFLLFADGLLHGQSPGKRLLGIKVVHLDRRTEAGFRESALRNFPIAFALLLHWIPAWGDVLVAGAGLGLATFEGLRVLTDGLGLRLGDLLAGTQVVDTKVVIGTQIRPLLKVVRSGGTQARGAARVLFEPTRPSEPTP